jgi:hypothetical protein
VYGRTLREHEQSVIPVRAFFEARVEHLSIHDRVRVECLGRMPDHSRCNRVVLIAVQGLNLPGYLLVKEIGRKLRCETCGERGHVDLTIIWADTAS